MKDDELKKYLKDLHEILELKIDLLEMKLNKIEDKIDGKANK